MFPKQISGTSRRLLSWKHEDFRAFLNLAMLMTESERAGLLRKAILDIRH